MDNSERCYCWQTNHKRKSAVYGTRGRMVERKERKEKKIGERKNIFVLPFFFFKVPQISNEKENRREDMKEKKL